MRERHTAPARLGLALGLLQILGGCSTDRAPGGKGADAGDAGPEATLPAPCPGPLRPDRCGAVCVSLASDARHCGDCGMECAAGASCVDGECACPAAAPDLCDDACVNTSSDPAHCGGCGESCAGFCSERTCNAARGLALGGQHTVLLMADGTLAGFGYNGFGQLGEGLSQSEPSATRLAAPPGVTEVSAGRTHTCVLVAGAVLCFGDNAFGQLGEAPGPSSSVPVEIGGVALATQVASGGRHGCALVEGGSVHCWGWNASGQVGDGTTAALRDVAVPVAGLVDAVEITAGGGHSCARTASGEVWCWGDNAQGQLGTGSRVRSPAPVRPTGLGVATSVRAGGTLTCALLDDATVTCWGGALVAALDAAVVGSLEPVPVPGLTAATAIAVGRAHACAIVKDGRVSCWGAAAVREERDASVATDGGLVLAPGLTGAVAIEAGDDHTCARLEDGAVWCWGDDAQGQLGRGSSGGEGATPAPVTWR